MNSINEVFTNQIIIKNSKFITYLYPINNETKIKNILIELKSNHKNATHYCYAYIIDNVKRFSDDGEPGGTAGMPLLSVLDKNELDNVLCVVIRYFGGIKLGTGGLVRAYTKSITSTLKCSHLIQLNKCLKVKLTFSYDDRKTIDDILKNEKIIDKIFDNNITYIFYTTLDNKTLFDNIPNIKLDIKEDYY